MSARTIPLIHEPSARLVDGSWRIEETWNGNDTRKSVAAFEHHLRSKNRYWRWLRKPMLWWGVVFFCACLAVAAMLAAGLTYGMTISYVPDFIKGSLFLILFILYLLLFMHLLVRAVRMKSHARAAPRSYPLIQLINTETITGELPGWKSELSWQEVSHFIESKEYFLIVHHGTFVTGVPKRAFSGDDALRDFSEFCMTSLMADLVQPS